MYNAAAMLEHAYLADDIDVVYGSQNKYEAFFRKLTFDGVPTTGTVMHELVHVYNSPSRLYFGEISDRADEGMAHGFENMYSVLEIIHSRVQKVLEGQKQSDQGLIEIRSGWSSAWGYGKLGNQGRLNDKSSTPCTLNGADFGQIRSKLGARVKCSEVSSELNKLAEKNGWCVRFSCDPNEARGYEITGNLNKAFLRYVIPPRSEIDESLK